MSLQAGVALPPIAVNLMVACRIAGVRIEDTLRWVLWLVAALLVVLLLVILFPQLALWLPRALGY